MPEGGLYSWTDFLVSSKWYYIKQVIFLLAMKRTLGVHKNIYIFTLFVHTFQLLVKLFSSLCICGIL